MRYIKVPSEVSLSEIKDNKFCLAPSKYNIFYPNKNVKFDILHNLISEPIKKRKKIIKNDIYKYIEIGDIDVYSGFIDGTKMFGYFLPSESSIEVMQNDILISTVRTYRRGIGIVDTEDQNLVCSPAILVIRDIDPVITKDYLFAILRSDFFIEQILAFQNRGMYPRLDADTTKYVYIPIPKSYDAIKYLGILVRSIIQKEREIRRKHIEIINIIDKEIKDNQHDTKFEFEFPNLKDLIVNLRIDAGFYSERLKKLQYYITNYKGGATSLDKQGLLLKPGPSLEIKLLGTRIDSNKELPGFYRLITPKQITNYGTVSYFEYIGTPRNICPIKYGDILFGESGTGRSIVYLDKHNNTINNAHAHILRPIEGQCSLEKAITIRSILQYYKEKGIIDYITVGGSGGHLSPSYFDRVYIPNFPDIIQKKISILYYNCYARYPKEKLTIDNFLDQDHIFNLEAGINELDSYSKKIQIRIDQIIDDIINDRPIDTDFKFLEQ